MVPKKIWRIIAIIARTVSNMIRNLLDRGFRTLDPDGSDDVNLAVAPIPLGYLLGEPKDGTVDIRRLAEEAIPPDASVPSEIEISPTDHEHEASISFSRPGSLLTRSGLRS